VRLEKHLGVQTITTRIAFYKGLHRGTPNLLTINYKGDNNYNFIKD